MFEMIKVNSSLTWSSIRYAKSVHKNDYLKGLTKLKHIMIKFINSNKILFINKLADNECKQIFQEIESCMKEKWA